jgi:hypothetical protein
MCFATLAALKLLLCSQWQKTLAISGFKVKRLKEPILFTA